MRREALEAAGMDVGGALTRLMGSEALLERLLGKFAADENCARLVAAAEADDADAALEAAHALKGVSGNLSMTRLYELTSRQCELIRGGDWPAARALTAEVASAHGALVDAIGAALA